MSVNGLLCCQMGTRPSFSSGRRVPSLAALFINMPLTKRKMDPHSNQGQNVQSKSRENCISRISLIVLLVSLIKISNSNFNTTTLWCLCSDYWLANRCLDGRMNRWIDRWDTTKFHGLECTFVFGIWYIFGAMSGGVFVWLRVNKMCIGNVNWLGGRVPPKEDR